MCEDCKRYLTIEESKKIIQDNNNQIKEFTKEKHPQYKEGSVMFKRRFYQYCRQVAFYRKHNLGNDLKYPAKYCLDKLYPKPKPPNKSLTVVFD